MKANRVATRDFYTQWGPLPSVSRTRCTHTAPFIEGAANERETLSANTIASLVFSSAPESFRNVIQWKARRWFCNGIQARSRRKFANWRWLRWTRLI